VPKHPLYRRMEERSIEMAFRIVAGLPEYDKADWD
jgi:hypothetical protein